MNNERVFLYIPAASSPNLHNASEFLYYGDAWERRGFNLLSPWVEEPGTGASSSE
ncbi:hypothetical protein YDYSG_65660 [Paenibacillus tyrfis]|nr:hypothetical protein YDYSG_65660 [Paenibacillus tyrfis]GMX61807.1 hypothetical protein Elgi_16110 [Paenibacillus elgii]